MIWQKAPFSISDDNSMLDIDRVCALLHGSRWAADRSRENIRTAIEHSICFGLFHENAQVGFSRFLTDNFGQATVRGLKVHRMSTISVYF